ncbi:MAG: hypothetical protein ACT4NY_26165 [Pseudonocardiales bacterium]
MEELAAPAGSVGHRLARQRTVSGLARQQLAARADIDVGLIAQVERGVVASTRSKTTAASTRGTGTTLIGVYHPKVLVVSTRRRRIDRHSVAVAGRVG